MNEAVKTIDALPDGRTLCYAVMTGMTVQGYNSTYLTTDDLKKLAASVPRWTRVEDGLPTEVGWYLVTILPPFNQKAQYHYFDGERFDVLNNETIAWMPLPEPFTEDTDEQR